MNVKYFSRSISILLVLYVLYLVKTSMGIDISSRYSAWEFVKAPVHPFIYK
jgi:hypothetical protein